MIKHGLKLWTSNPLMNFQQINKLVKNNSFHFVELFYNSNVAIDFNKITLLEKIDVSIHCTYFSGFHEFNIGRKQQKIWSQIIYLADFLQSKHIIVHPGLSFSFKQFKNNLEKIEDERILIENMAGIDLFGQQMYGSTLAELENIKKIKDICFDFEKAIKSAIFYRHDYKLFIKKSIGHLQPTYFHISGCDCKEYKDQHKNLWEADFDLKWIKNLLDNLSQNKEIKLVFETPKIGEGLENDLKNLEFFKNIK